MRTIDPDVWLVLGFGAVVALLGWAIASDVGVERAPLTAIGFVAGATFALFEIDRIENRNDREET